MNFGIMDQTEMYSPSDAFVRNIEIHELLPQRDPFIMIGGLCHFDMACTVSSLHIKESNLFVSNGKLTSLGIIENIAQTCAARIGYINKYILLKGIQVGVIGAINEFELYDLPRVGETIITEIRLIDEVFGMLLVSATVNSGNKLMATTKMKIAIKDEGIKGK
jgi:predicted hotdog family 3-hydroxylacyl-ACP dehydratase